MFRQLEEALECFHNGCSFLFSIRRGSSFCGSCVCEDAVCVFFFVCVCGSSVCEDAVCFSFSCVFVVHVFVKMLSAHHAWVLSIENSYFSGLGVNFLSFS